MSNISIYGVGLDIQQEYINNKLRIHISQKKGNLSIRTLQQLFDQFDVNQSGKLNLEQLIKGLNSFGFFLKHTEYQALLKYYDLNQDGFVDFKEFVKGIRVPLNERRKNLVLKIFDKLDCEKKGEINSDFLSSKLHNCIFTQEKLEETLQSEFRNSFYQKSNISKEDFLIYYEDFSLQITSDQQFVEILQNQWCIQENDNKQNAENEARFYANLLQLQLRKALNGDFKNEEKVKKLFRIFDSSRNEFISIGQVDLVVKKFGIFIENKYLNGIFGILDNNKSGQVEYQEFYNFIQKENI